MSHFAKHELTCEEFTSLWDDISPSLRRLGTSQQHLDFLRTADLDPMQTRLSEAQVREQALADQCAMMEVRKKLDFEFDYCNNISTNKQSHLSHVL